MYNRKLTSNPKDRIHFDYALLVSKFLYEEVNKVKSIKYKELEM